MGYTTKFDGIITTVPKMDWTMRAAIREYCANADVGKVGKNADLDGTCDWKGSDDFTGLVHNGMEKSYDQDQWLQALINDLLAPAGFVCNGIVDAQGEDVSDRWRIIVRDNVVERDDFTGPSYAEQVNAPLSEETITAINEQLASGDVPKYKRASKDGRESLAALADAAKAKSLENDEKLAELRAKLHPEPEEPPAFDARAALRDLGNAIVYKSGMGLNAIADFAAEIEGALETVTNTGNMGPLDTLFQRVKDEHAADMQRADASAALDDDIPSEGFAFSNIDPPEGYGIPESVKRYVREYLNDDRSQTAAMIHQALQDDDLDALEETVNSTGDRQFMQGVDNACRQAAIRIAKATMTDNKIPQESQYSDADLGKLLTAEDIADRYPMTIEQAQEMIDGGAVESGGILFVNEEARDEFAAWAKNDREKAEAEHAAAWQKIHADQAAEERVRANLKEAHDRLLEEKSAQESREMAEEAARASQELWDAGVYKDAKPIREPGPQDFAAAGDPAQWDDTALNEYWLIWSNKHDLWWMPHGTNYTPDIAQAGRYTFDQAVKIVKKSCTGWDYQRTSLPPTTMVPDPYQG